MVLFYLHSLRSMELEMGMQLHGFTWYQIEHHKVSVMVVWCHALLCDT